MKRIISLILVVCMLCTLGLALTSCGTSIESVKEKCDKLKEDGEIAGYIDASFAFSQFDGFKGAIAVLPNGTSLNFLEWDEDDHPLMVIEFEEKDDAKACEEDYRDDAGEDDIVKRKGNVVIVTDNKDLYDLVF